MKYSQTLSPFGLMRHGQIQFFLRGDTIVIETAGLTTPRQLPSTTGSQFTRWEILLSLFRFISDHVMFFWGGAQQVKYAKKTGLQ